MTAAVYVRKSTEQHGVADEQKSVERQKEHARAYARRHGWTVDDAHVYVDDGISGAEFAARPGFVRLMAALKPRAPFTVLVMSEVSRLGREQIETAYALKQLSQAGVRCFSYLDDRELVMESATDKFLLGAVTFAADLEREKARQRTYDAMLRKAKAGHVTGGSVFGYTNVDVVGADGKRSHVERRIHNEQAAVVRQIFDLCAKGLGHGRVAKTLNDAHALAPKPRQKNRLVGWTPDTVKHILNRSLYRGEIVWAQIRKRDQWGQHKRAERPAAEHVTVAAPHLRIVSDAQWHAAHARLTTRRAKTIAAARGRVNARARDLDSAHLLAGFARCATCGGSWSAVVYGGRRDGANRYCYACLVHHKRGGAICDNGLRIPVDRVNAAVLQTIGDDVLRPAVWVAVLDKAWARVQAAQSRNGDEAIRTELAMIDRALDNLAEAIAAAGGPIDALVAKLKAAQSRREALMATLAPQLASAGFRYRRRDVERHVRTHVDYWRGLLSVAGGRRLLRGVLAGPITFRADGRAYRFEGDASLGGLLAGVVGDAVTPFPLTRSGMPAR